ncbi:DoxX family protein [Patescibacteria group bacterium]|nr:DoxX family protein [Patescibacteria group bacterium]
MITVFVIGRVIFGLFIVFSGFNHIKNFKHTRAYTQSLGVPASGFLTVLTGLMLLFGGISFLLWQWVDLGILVLVLFFVPVTLIAHAFWKKKDTTQRVTEMHSFMGNMMILGLLLIIFPLLY